MKDEATATVVEKRSRRGLLALVGAGGAAAVAALFSRRNGAEANPGPISGDSDTKTPGVLGVNTGGDMGHGVEGHSSTGIGVWGEGALAGVFGRSTSTQGVYGDSTTGEGVFGLSVDGIGVLGNSTTGEGVFGAGHYGVFGHGTQVGTGAGVRGNSGLGVVGVWGMGSGPGDDGVRAEGTAGATALRVIGPARFSTAGAGVVPARTDAATVSDPAVAADSHISLTFMGDPGPAQVAWVERLPGTGFTVHLSRPARLDVPFTYLIVGPNS